MKGRGARKGGEGESKEEETTRWEGVVEGEAGAECLIGNKWVDASEKKCDEEYDAKAVRKPCTYCLLISLPLPSLYSITSGDTCLSWEQANPTARCTHISQTPCENPLSQLAMPLPAALSGTSAMRRPRKSVVATWGGGDRPQCHLFLQVRER